MLKMAYTFGSRSILSLFQRGTQNSSSRLCLFSRLIRKLQPYAHQVMCIHIPSTGCTLSNSLSHKTPSNINHTKQDILDLGSDTKSTSNFRNFRWNRQWGSRWKRRGWQSRMKVKIYDKRCRFYSNICLQIR